MQYNNLIATEFSSGCPTYISHSTSGEVSTLSRYLDGIVTRMRYQPSDELVQFERNSKCRGNCARLIPQTPVAAT